MAGKRDYINEILSKKSRLIQGSPRWTQVAANLDRIIECLDELEPTLENERYSTYSEILPYFPIQLVANFEGFFRLAYAELIDRVPAFQDNVSKLDIKFTLQVAISLRHHSVSMGDFVAHLLPISSLDDINRNMAQITGDDFLEKLKTVRPKVYPLVQMALLPEWQIDEDAQIISRVKRIFELRHIYCHEPARTEVLDIRDVREYSYSAIKFLHISEEVVRQYLTS